MGPFLWVAAGVIPAVVVGIATGAPEELIFRGVLQTATRPILGRLNWIYVSLVFAVLHIAHFAELATPVRAKRPPWIGVLATPSEAAAAADAGRPLHPLILTSFRFVAR